MTWEPDYDVWDITVDEGKYRFRSVLNREHPDAGPSRTRDAWRSGEWWEGGTEWLRTMRHMKSFASLMTEFETARRALRALRDRSDFEPELVMMEDDAAIMRRAMAEAGNEQS